MKKRKKQAAEVEAKGCSTRPTLHAKWLYEVDRGPSQFSITGGDVRIEAEQRKGVSLHVYGWAGRSGGMIEGLSEADCRCVAEQLTAAANQLAVWKAAS